MLIIFWFAVIAAAYAYAGYPIALRVVSAVRRRPVIRADISPRVSVIVTVYNGAGVIRGKLENLLAQDYPKDRLEILIADDGSDDGTGRIVADEFQAHGVRLVALADRGGKERAQKAAVAVAGGEVLVFTDVGTSLDAHGIASIVRSFADPTVGAVSSEDRLASDKGQISAGEGGYVGYEMRLRRLETQVGSIVGLSGSLFAVRREICSDFSDRLASDFRTALCTVRAGMRAVSDEGAIGYYKDVATTTREFDRKVRTVVRGMTVLFAEASLLNPLRYGLFSWQLASHKLARWLVPVAMLAALASSAWLAHGSRFFVAALVAQLAAYLVFAWTRWSPRPPEWLPLKALHYLMEANLAILVAWARYLRGDRIVVWTPSKR